MSNRPKAPASVLSDRFDQLGDDALQAHFLHGVSRTFALTIPTLPPPLYRVVANAYLLCRIVDTVEDEVALSELEKNEFCERFVRVVEGELPASTFSERLAPRLSAQTLPAEHELIAAVPRVVHITHGFAAEQRQALVRCVRIMSRGMAEFQRRDLHHGLRDLEDLSLYCYYVAGVVGEMLTELFCHYSAEMARQRDSMMALAVSFGQGLQMTNILKDIWDDAERGVCWLPRSVFEARGLDVATLHQGIPSTAVAAVLEELIAIAHGHLRNALQYTLLIPRHETGVRDFCLWALGMAVLTLRKINARRNFTAGRQVKISRRSVRGVVGLSRLLHSSDTGLKIAFELASLGLPSSAQLPLSASVQALAE